MDLGAEVVHAKSQRRIELLLCGFASSLRLCVKLSHERPWTRLLRLSARRRYCSGIVGKPAASVTNPHSHSIAWKPARGNTHEDISDVTHPVVQANSETVQPVKPRNFTNVFDGERIHAVRCILRIRGDYSWQPVQSFPIHRWCQTIVPTACRVRRSASSCEVAAH